MNKLYKSILLAILGSTSITAVAQNASKDTTYNRQVLLERDFNPTLNDASKINLSPSVYEVNITKYNAQFTEGVPNVQLNNNVLGKVNIGDIATNVEFSKKRGYFTLSAGMNSNLEGAAGFKIVNTIQDQLGIYANHSSMSGDVDYLHKNYLYKKMKAKYSDSQIALKYAHKFEPSILSFGASYFNTGYNYYGNSFGNYSFPSGDPFNYNTRQNVNVLNFNLGLRSDELSKSPLRYNAYAGYSHFKSKYGLNTDQDGPKGGIFNLGTDINTDFGADRTIGIKANLMNQSFRGAKNYSVPNAYHYYTNIEGTPYAKFEGAGWKATLGLNVNLLFDVKTNVFFSPDVTASYTFFERNVFYGSVTGGINNNTYLDILQENRYVNPISRVEYSKTPYDLLVGFKSGVVDGLEFDVFGGYKRTNKEHLYVTTTNVGSDTWGNLGTPIYADVSTGKFGGLIKTSLIPYTTLSAKAALYFYNVKYTNSYINSSYLPVMPSEKKAWGLPTVTFELNADVKAIDNLVLSLNYQYAGGRKACYITGAGTTSSALKMKDINELNFKGEYSFTDWLAVYVRLNNVLFQKYERYYGYSLQGFNAMGGVSLKF